MAETEKFGLSMKEFAAVTDVHTATVYRLVRKGLIKTIWVGSKLIVPAQEVERLRREGCPTPRGRTRTPESYKRKATRAVSQR